MSPPASWLRDHAAERRGQPAIVTGDETWSWGELDRLATAAERAWPDGRSLALVAAPSAESIAIIHAALRTPHDLVVLHPRAAGAEAAAQVATAAAGLVATDPASVDALAAQVAVPVRSVDEVVATLHAATDPVPPSPATGDPPGDRASASPDGRGGTVIVPTSGTTGPARLAILPASSLAASAAAWSTVVPPATGWLLSLGLAHVAGLAIVVRAAAAGVPVVVPAALDARAILEAIRGAADDGVAVSHLSLVAVQLERLLDEVADEPPPASLRAVLLGGGPIPQALVARALLAGWPIVTTYGLTETASGVAALPTAELVDAPWSDGRPLPGVELRACDPEDAGSTALESGAVGELHVRGPMVFAGYLDDADATAAALGTDGWLRTGDLGRIDELGRVEVIDRLDDLIVSGGENVAPAEIEGVLMEHPDVFEVGVVGVPDPTWGRVPVAVVVPREGRPLDEEALRSFVRERLAAFKVPARVVTVQSLPRTAGGKLLRRELRSMTGIDG